MNSFRKMLFVLLTVTALAVGVVSPAAAASAPQASAPQASAQPAGAPPAPALRCSEGTCQIPGAAAGPLGLLQLGANLALTQLPFQTTADGASQATLDAHKDITLALPVGQLTLTNARLQVAVGADGKITQLNGSADMPFPTFGLLDDTHVVTPARASVGLDLGKNIPVTDIELQPDRPYLFFNANSFMAVAGRAPGSAETASLAFAPGQRLTLIVDTVEPVAYLNGQVTLSLTDQVALLGGILESTPLGPYVPDTLPLRERTQYGLSGKFSKDLAESRLTLRGGYVVDAGLLPASLGVDAKLASLRGEVTLSRDGVLIDGLLESAIDPDKVFDGSVHVVTFVSLNQAAGPSYAKVDASVQAPAAHLGVAAGAQASAGSYELRGQLTTPFRSSDLKGRVAGKLPNVAGTVGPAAGKAASAVGSAAHDVGAAIGATAGKAAAFVGPLAGRAGAFVGSRAQAGFDWVGRTIRPDGAAAQAEATTGM